MEPRKKVIRKINIVTSSYLKTKLRFKLLLASPAKILENIRGGKRMKKANFDKTLPLSSVRKFIVFKKKPMPIKVNIGMVRFKTSSIYSTF